MVLGLHVLIMSCPNPIRTQDHDGRRLNNYNNHSRENMGDNASKNSKAVNKDPNIAVRPTESSILGITGHRLAIRGCCELLIRDYNSSHILCEFLVSETGLSILKSLEVKSDGKTSRICGYYKLTLNSRLLKQTCTKGRS
ncbi:unnamed protein product [Schistosoma margrebowiei]|uniref:Uncharacterized protein n=1 Tax=Schistosoma margrebowiei TaxID=48269 RepID=A0AA84ZQC8_9TREM|nr:unnamed protein product [Schistosoma margrebowiei]